ncbi:LEA type 2 family protein [Pseudonocardia spirodelae]|uniref:LEA type 2 family protein n=1 Tax=Pseudonocardia spirodelae TaxID=3133431 RepID=A0ABU8T9B3_9PSEU
MLRPPRAVLVAALALLTVTTGCSTTVSHAEVAARAAAEAAAADGVGHAEPAPVVTGFGRPHTFPGGSVVAVSPPRGEGADPAQARVRTATVTLTLTNPTGAPVDLSGLDVAATADGAGLTASGEEDRPEVRLPPGGTARFDVGFPLPAAHVREFAVTVTLTAVDADGEDVEGSDHAPGASATFGTVG